jgi:hypothetical protein
MVCAATERRVAREIDVGDVARGEAPEKAGGGTGAT